MSVTLKNIKDANTFELNEINKIYNQSFPKQERISFDYLLSMTTNSNVKFLIAFKNEIIGLVFLIEKENEALVYYFAINTNLRSKGYGSLLLTELKNMYKNLIIIMEVIDKNSNDYDIQNKRFKFYQKNGLKLTNYRLIDYSGEFELLSLDKSINARKIQSMLNIIDNGNFNFTIIKK